MLYHIKHIKNYLVIALTLAPLLLLAEKTSLKQPTLQNQALQNNEVIRAAIDIGSGATKLKVAEINLTDKKIDKVLAVENYSVQYQEALMNSSDHMFSEQIMQEGIDALIKAKAIADQYGATKTVAVATASFRSGKNAQEFIDRIYNETGIKVHIIDQDLEGILNFEAATAQVDFPPEELIVWDIGGGSYQFTTLDQEGNLVVHRGSDASIPFKNHVITHIKRQDLKDTNTPNPISPKQMVMTEHKAREIAEKVDTLFKEKIQNPNTKVIGVGSIFSYNINPLVFEQYPYTKEHLDHRVQHLVGKTDEQVGGGEYANVYITNPALIVGFMKSLGINEVYIEDVNNADGALLYPEFWK